MVCSVYIIVVCVATLRVLDGIACCVVAVLYYTCIYTYIAHSHICVCVAMYIHQTRRSTSPWRPSLPLAYINAASIAI